MTIEEFLAWDDGTDTRYEVVDGVPVAMAPPAGARRIIAGNAATLIGVNLRRRGRHPDLGPRPLAGRPSCDLRAARPERRRAAPRRRGPLALDAGQGSRPQAA